MLAPADSGDPREAGGHKKRESLNDLVASNTPIAPPKVGWRMVLGRQKSPGTSFEAGRTPRARAPGRRRVLQGPFGRLQEALWRFQRALGRLQEVLEGFWAENIDFSFFFQGFGWQQRLGAVRPRVRAGTP